MVQQSLRTVKVFLWHKLNSHIRTKRYSRQKWLHSIPYAHYLFVMRCRMSRNYNKKKINVELAWGGSFGNPGHSLDGACVRSIATWLGKHCTHTQDIGMMRSHWWTHSDAATHACPAKKQKLPEEGPLKFGRRKRWKGLRKGRIPEARTHQYWDREESYKD